MKIAITADVHLTSREKNPERVHAFENILDQLVNLKIENIIIAGDLFDASCKDPGEFEKILNNAKYASITATIIPGNHDPLISEGAFALQNIHYISRPRLVKFSSDAVFLFIPYQANSSLGEALASFPDELPPNAWVLVAHGDNLASTRLRNTYESGLYMPLSGRDIQLYKPKKVFLGHIHARMDADIVHYPGSPCGLDPTETGVRSYLIYDTESGHAARVPVETDFIYYQEVITVLPLKDEEAYISQILSNKVSAWKLDDDQKKKVRVRINLQGYSTNREILSNLVVELLGRHKIKLIEPPDLSKVRISNDVMRAEIASSVQKRILELYLPDNPDEPTRDEIILSAMNQIYRA